MNLLAAKDCMCQSERYRKAFGKRQELRRAYLGVRFQSPAAPQPAAPVIQAGAVCHARRRAAQRRPVPRPAPPPQQVAVPDPPPPPPAARAPLRPACGWRRLLAHTAILSMWILALCVYLPGMVGTGWLMNWCAEPSPAETFGTRKHPRRFPPGYSLVGRPSIQEPARNANWGSADDATILLGSFARSVNPWPLVGHVWAVRMDWRSWLFHTVHAALPIGMHLLLILVAMKMLAIAAGIRRRWVGDPAPNQARRRANLLASFFFLSGSPCVCAGAVALAIVTWRASWVVSTEACCFLLLLLPAEVLAMAYGVFYLIPASIWLTKKLSESVWDI